MTSPAPLIEVRAAEARHVEPLRAQRQQRLLAPDDDMWATFADQAAWHTIHLDGDTVGCCSVDDDRRLHAFSLIGRVEPLGPDLLARAVRSVGATAIVASTIDPVPLTWSLLIGARAEPVALMYRHLASGSDHRALDMRPATGDDLGPAAAFFGQSTGSPDGFLQHYLGRRIELGELHLSEADGSIIAAGECRVHPSATGYAHLGVVVGPAARGQGLGTRVLETMAEQAKSHGLVPLCSTEPTNTAAQHAIWSSGFRLQHTVTRVTM